MDEKLDKTEPDRSEPPPIDNDDDPVAPATDHSYRRGDVKGGYRPLKGGYWFIREKYRDEIAKAIMEDIQNWEETKREMEFEEREQQYALQWQQRPQSPEQHYRSVQPPPLQYFQTSQPSPGQFQIRNQPSS